MQVSNYGIRIAACQQQFHCMIRKDQSSPISSYYLRSATQVAIHEMKLFISGRGKQCRILDGRPQDPNRRVKRNLFGCQGV